MLTPENGTREGMTCGPSLVTKYHSARENLFRGFVKGACGRQCAIIWQKDCLRFTRKFSGMRGDVARYKKGTS
jgi:hypothetical protein